MKYLLVIFLALFGNNAKAQDFLPILAEGRSWQCRDSSFMRGGSFTVEVAGDTLAYGYSCKKIRYKKSGYIELALEENGRLYRLEPENENDQEVCNTPTLICDFNLNIGDTAWEEEITKVDTIEVRGVKRRRISTDGDYWPRPIWVEGIGSYTDGWYSTMPRTVSHLFSYIEACYDNGELIFTKDDFFAPSVTAGISNIESAIKHNGQTYDLSDRRIDNPIAKGVYIKDGRKYVKR